jgi:hypothetical protein
VVPVPQSALVAQATQAPPRQCESAVGQSLLVKQYTHPGGVGGAGGIEVHFVPASCAPLLPPSLPLLLPPSVPPLLLAVPLLLPVPLLLAVPLLLVVPLLPLPEPLLLLGPPLLLPRPSVLASRWGVAALSPLQSATISGSAAAKGAIRTIHRTLCLFIMGTPKF